ncbi:CIA30 family protein [Oceaniglobus indicus]|uniref:CIA30 family protein n=1 Tax=Oceaniglobus indicus TaxID=2047749 RepID=UPI000C17711A|nr:CIA30 family protein [Oceaniglobus indicus]
MLLDAKWEYVADTVMGGVSRGRLTDEPVSGRPAHRLTGDVSLENDGGFVQMAFDLCPDGGAFDASAFDGVEIDVIGNGEHYDLRLRTTDLVRPWQSFRTEFRATPEWQSLRLPFAAFAPHKTDAAFDPAALRRIGILGIGRVFHADVAVAAARLI